MGAKRLAVLDIGSDAITLVLQDSKYENNILFKGAVEYSGYQDGEFFYTEEIVNAIHSLVAQCEEVAFVKPDSFLIGVPGEFTTVICKNVTAGFEEPRAVTADDLDALLEKGNTYDNHNAYKTINAAPIHYVLENGKRSMCPVGEVTASVSAYISYVLAERKFLRLFDSMADALNVHFEYTSTILAEGMFVVPEAERDKGVILLDVGYISSTLAYLKGDGILYMSSFSLGGGHLAADLNLYRKIPFAEAKELVSKINLNRMPSETDEYSVSVKGRAYTHNMQLVNEVADYTLGQIAETVEKAIAAAVPEIPPFVSILLTGSGICQTAGAKEYIQAATERGVRILSPELLQFNKPAGSAVAGLIGVQGRQIAAVQPSFFTKIKEFFKRRRKS